jgi:hypothetical protein
MKPKSLMTKQCGDGDINDGMENASGNLHTIKLQRQLLL